MTAKMLSIFTTRGHCALVRDRHRLRCRAARALLPLSSESCAKFQWRKMANHTPSDDSCAAVSLFLFSCLLSKQNLKVNHISVAHIEAHT